MIMPHIVMAFIILAPLFAMSLLISVCNVLSMDPADAHIVQAVNEYNNGFKEYGLNLIKYSPLFLLVLCFIVQGALDPEIRDKVDINNLRAELKKLNISIIFSET